MDHRKAADADRVTRDSTSGKTIMKPATSQALLFLVLAAFVAAGCTETVDGGGDEWPLDGSAGSDADVSDPGDDAMDGDTASADDTMSGEDTMVPPPDTDVPTDVEDPTPDESSLAGTTWFGVLRWTEEPAVTGTGFRLELQADNAVEVGAYGELVGKWELFEETRLRLYELERNGEPNEPTQLVFDLVVEQDRVRALEILIPRQQQRLIPCAWSNSAPTQTNWRRWRATGSLWSPGMGKMARSFDWRCDSSAVAWDTAYSTAPTWSSCPGTPRFSPSTMVDGIG